jgi:hypothetical protein
MVKTNAYVKVSAVIAYLIMVTFNILANLIPLNGVTTGELSDRYPSLITPAGYAFLIWSLIYTLLLVYSFFQLELFGHNRMLTGKVSGYIRLYFILSCFSNAAWIIAWHYNYIALSLMLMIIILVCLCFINTYAYSEELSLQEKILIRLPFSIYFGWITVATVVNTSVLLISIRWTGYGIPAWVWTIVAALVILVVATINTIKYKSLAYAATVIWAYVGILVKHTATTGLNNKYPEVIIAVILCILILLSAMGYIVIKKKKYGF